MNSASGHYIATICQCYFQSLLIFDSLSNSFGYCYQQTALATRTSVNHYQMQQYQGPAHAEHQLVPVTQLHHPYYKSQLGSLKANFVAIQQPSPTPNPAAAVELIFLLRLPSCPAPQQLQQLSVVQPQLQEFQCNQGQHAVSPPNPCNQQVFLKTMPLSGYPDHHIGSGSVPW